jgi:hypothetical protein
MTNLHQQLNNSLQQLSTDRLKVLVDFAAYLAHRVIYSVDDTIVQVIVVAIAHRSEVYEL